MSHATVPAIGTIWRNDGEHIVVCHVLIDPKELGGFSITAKAFDGLVECVYALGGDSFNELFALETEPPPHVLEFAKALLASASSARSEIEMAYRQRLVENLRNGGAPVRRLLADEIASGKWDGAK